ncbi:unnamed protein product [Rhizophagus irregularis]|uniref:F-box domain-containing protein n=1 Tax=Rhizophagus irregularis TaxID=588596 RepID=A0A2I1GCV5_9GLOM|nr:hypothetical protein RhiirA4_541862 [Rhizophagus irregularis]CAB4407741.1 unnamed protein product [Rhizophagus irregularis]
MSSPSLKKENFLSMNNASLNFDILTKIFEQFFIYSRTEDIKIADTLFACTLVNKQWCESALPLLWRDPFQFISDDSPSNDKAGELVTTLLCCLTKEECQQFYLTMKGYIGPKFISLPPLFRRRPFFNYPNYIKHLHTKGLINSAWNWFKITYQNGEEISSSNTSELNSSSITTSSSSGTLNSISLKDRSNSSLSINNDTSNSDAWSKSERRTFVEQIIECLLQMFVARNVGFKNVYVENDFNRCFFKGQFINCFKQIQKLDILEMRIPEYPDMLNIWKDFSNLTSLSIKVEYPLDNHYSNLSRILQSTSHLRKLKLVSGETKYILPLLSPKYSSSIQHLIFDSIAFDTSDAWHLLSNFTQLRKMKLIQCWFNPIVDDDSKQKMFSIITQMQFNHLKLFVCVTNEVNIEDEAKSELVLWGVQQHAIVALENPGLENVRIYHESMISGLQVDAVKHHRYTSYMKEIKKSLKTQS